MRVRAAVLASVVTVAILVGVVAVSGVRIHQLTRPSPVAAVEDLDDLVADVEALDRWRAAHRVAGIALGVVFPAVLVALVVVAMRAGTVSPGRPMAAVLAGAVLLMVALYLGYAVPWDQTALWAVTVGEDLAGFTPVFGEDARVSLVVGEVSGRTIVWLGRIHKWVLTVPIVVSFGYVGWLAWRAGGEPLGGAGGG